MILFGAIDSKRDLARVLGVPYQKLTYILYNKKVDSYYTSFEIPKKTGGSRRIKAPTGELKDIQKRLAGLLWEHQMLTRQVKNVHPNISHAFERGKGIISNAHIHRNKRIVVNLDLEDYFESFHFGRVRGFFEKNKDYQLPLEVATIIAQLTCFEGSLPQGAPSSPIITNLISQILDMRLLQLAKEYKLDYTRYADDLTFSTNNKAFIGKWEKFYDALEREIEEAGFKVNAQKTRMQYRDSRQTVTGLVVNKKLSVNRRYYKMVRAMANNLYLNGSFLIDGVQGTPKQLEGRFAFIDQLDKYNNGLKPNEKHNYRTLNGRERQYQKFLFYRYFFANEKPLIVTEGKTDVAYLKAALKNRYKEYPSLIERNEDGCFTFKVSFLKRSKRLEYFFNFSLDGADAMTRLYNFFSNNEKENYPNYLNQFMEITGRKPEKPVIFLFDNEMENSEKPLCKFLRQIKATQKERKKLQQKLHLKLISEGNLYLVTNPLIGEKEECEIEDLFDEKTRNHEIYGRTLSLESKPDVTRFYGKNEFSKYIQNNYRTIDFSKFTEILDNIQAIIEGYSSALGLKCENDKVEMLCR